MALLICWQAGELLRASSCAGFQGSWGDGLQVRETCGVKRENLLRNAWEVCQLGHICRLPGMQSW